MSTRLTSGGARPGGARPGAAVALAGISLVAGAALGSVFLSTARDSWAAIAAAGPAGPGDGILLLTALSGTLLSLWLGLGMTLSALSALPGALGHTCRQLAARVAPAAVRKVVAFVLGTTLTAALVPGTAIATTGSIGQGPARGAEVATSRQARHPSGSALVAAPDASFRFVAQTPHGNDSHQKTQDPGTAPLPSWLPERPASRTIDSGRTDRMGAVVVLRGDSLWSIAAHRLGPAATPADIEVEWHRWLAANLDVIGDDPDLILPGQRLSPPPLPGAGS